MIRITRIGERAGQRKERCCRATFAAFDLERSERHRIAVFFEKGELAGPAFITHDIVGRIARARRIAVVEDPRQKRPHRTWGQLPPDTERHRIEHRTFRPLVTTDAMQQIVLDAVSVAQQPPAAAAGQFARKDRPLARPFACHGTYMPPLGRSPVAPCRSDRPQPLRRRRHDELAARPPRDETGGIAHDFEARRSAERRERKTSQENREAGYFMTRNFTRIKIRHTERRMNSLEIRRDEVKDTKNRAQKQTFMFDYAETMYLRRSQRYGKCGGLQIFHRQHAGFRSRSHLLYDRKREYPIEKRRFTGRTHENAGLAVQKKSR